MASDDKANVSGKVMGAAKKAASWLSGETGILATLKQEHGEVSALMGKVVATEGKDNASRERQQVFQQVRRELLAHARGEEREFYPRLLQFPETEPLARQSMNEHQDIEALLEQLARMDDTDAGWMNTFRALRDNVQHHVKEEENDLFPRVADVLDKDRLREMNDGYEQVHRAELSALS
ncbi:MAG: hemerythrin domain-containing protein [Myxococcales bacterium]|nr:hemerythrin domain-containing protein [Myxococcales bacterium]